MPASEQQAMKRQSKRQPKHQSKRKHNTAHGDEQSFLAKYTPPLIDSGIHDELLDFVNRREAACGAPNGL
tara:strand:+ start:1745 stop:1954 length:210 start_codon:yes stop_codon:yes gene_type:complete